MRASCRLASAVFCVVLHSVASARASRRPLSASRGLSAKCARWTAPVTLEFLCPKWSAPLLRLRTHHRRCAPEPMSRQAAATLRAALASAPVHLFVDGETALGYGAGPPAPYGASATSCPTFAADAAELATI